MSSVPIFFIFCIDYQFVKLAVDYLTSIGLAYHYFSATGAGGALSIGYEKYCKNKCSEKGCIPSNQTMELLKNNLSTNLDIAKTLQPVNEILLMNHQDCGAMKAFLPCSGYPKILGSDNIKEIKINQDILVYSKEYLLSKYPNQNFKFKLALIDINGCVGIYDTNTKSWTVVFRGKGINPLGLWCNLFYYKE